jgi:hypothetical protein
MTRSRVGWAIAFTISERVLDEERIADFQMAIFGKKAK